MTKAISIWSNNDPDPGSMYAYAGREQKNSDIPKEFCFSLFLINFYFIDLINIYRIFYDLN
jgi:hypothetical protein